MQEDVENKVAQLVITTTKLSLRVILLAMKKFIQYQKSLKAKKTSKKAVGIKGKQSVKALIGQNQGVSNIEIAETNIKDFDRIARKYGVDFAIKKEWKPTLL